ncbi:hypothetical protein [Intrasporangium sp.]|uniref:hypothetical protein n=1 Tax=Intrasporangium sp. TaxID=1925024 RepID=UPI003221C461
MSANLIDAYVHDMELALAGPFGQAHFNPTRALAPFSQAWFHGAVNLLHRAAAALADGDRARCVALVGRVARMPYDDHECACPGAIAANLLPFDAMVEAIEDSPAGDDTWLRAAVEVTDRSPAAAQQELRHVLSAILHDFELEARESRLLSRVVDRLPVGPALRESGPLDPVELAPLILGLVEATAAYRDLLGLRSPAGS